MPLSVGRLSRLFSESDTSEGWRKMPTSSASGSTFSQPARVIRVRGSLNPQTFELLKLEMKRSRTALWSLPQLTVSGGLSQDPALRCSRSSCIDIMARFSRWPFALSGAWFTTSPRVKPASSSVPASILVPLRCMPRTIIALCLCRRESNGLGGSSAASRYPLASTFASSSLRTALARAATTDQSSSVMACSASSSNRSI